MRIYKEYIILSKNKELITNLLAIGVVISSFFTPSAISHHLFYTGAFALSGSLTNQIAIHMLFNKVPFFYGSGIIELKFEELKLSIKELILEEFFSIQKLKEHKIELSPMIEKFDFSPSFDALLESISESKFANLINLIGGPTALEALREPFTKKLKSSLIKLANSGIDFSEGLTSQIDSIVQKRLDELTPTMVKQMLHSLMKEHLGWLVIWGGVFGGFIGLVSSFIR